MAEMFMNRKLFAMLRATRTATGAKSVTRQQPETEYEAPHEEEEPETVAQTNEHPADGIEDSDEPVAAAEDARGNAHTLRILSGDCNLCATWTTGINSLWRCAADEGALLAAQIKDTALDAVQELSQLGFIGTANAIGH
jgi:hypothetical protein